ncbi:MAG TPA: PH domain-containing protein, partial [Thermomicrobiales bacterium]|nr:PH domain-containing protein [Thermomicrobiales bacterium]
WILTDRRLIRHTGVINIQERSIPLKNIQDVNYSASVIGRMLNYGNLTVESASETEANEAMVNVGNAAGFRSAIFEAIENFGADDFPGRRR